MFTSLFAVFDCFEANLSYLFKKVGLFATEFIRIVIVYLGADLTVLCVKVRNLSQISGHMSCNQIDRTLRAQTCYPFIAQSQWFKSILLKKALCFNFGCQYMIEPMLDFAAVVGEIQITLSYVVD